MAATRPAVLVYQEFASLSSSPATPELNCLVAGPAYWIQDFPDHRADIKLATNYGTLNVAQTDGTSVAPVGAGVVIAPDAPNNKIGAILDASSVKVYFGSPRVELAIAESCTVVVTPTPSPVLLTATNLATAGVLPGDWAVLTDNAGTNTQVKKIRSALNRMTAVAGIDFVAAGVLPGDTLVVTTTTGNDGSYPITAVNSALQVEVSTPFPTLGPDATTTLSVKRGIVVVIAPVSVDATTSNALLFTDDVVAPFVNAADVRMRIERTLADSLIDSSFVTVTPATNIINIAGEVTLLVGGVAKYVSFGEVYVAYRSLRQELADVITLGGVTEIVGQLGLIDARNPLAVGMFTALTNAGTSIQGYGVQSNDLVGYTAMKGALANRKDIYAVVPLVQDVSVIAMLKAEFENLADPEYAITNGVAQKFRMVIGAPTALPSTKLVIDTQGDGDVEQFGAAGTAIRTFTFPTLVNFITAGARPGDTLVIAADDAGTVRNGSYTIAHINSATSCEVTTNIPGIAQTGVANTTVTVTRGLTTVIATTAAIASVASSANDALWLDLFDTTGTFIDDGVLPGDFLEMPTDPTQTSFTSSVKLEIETIVSNQRVRIKNNGSNTALLDTELPHGASRTAPVTAIPTTPTLFYRVVRNLDKTGQVTELISVAQSLQSRRAVICWPDSVDVSGLVDGSLARDPATPTVAQPAAPQPGYYLACAVGGMLATLPSHQGLTNMGIAGISKIYNANTYFDDRQMTQISNGGWLVFQQDTPSALPYIIHQLTTDPSTLEFGEISLVKNFDFVSLFFSDILDDFLGTWNINAETIHFIDSALNAGLQNLKLRRKIRIGAPIIDGRVTSVAESVASSDRIEAYIEVDFPKPLNTIGLHIVSI